MLSASASIPPTTQVVFAVAFGEPGRQCLLKEVVQASGLARPQRGNHPSIGTTFGSSKAGRIV